MWGASPEPGDWVTARRPIAHGLTGSIRAGTKGVVTRRDGSFIDVDFATGYGTASVSTRVSNCTVTRSNGGLEQFRRRTHVLSTIRVVLALYLLWPIISFTAQYLWQEHTLDGIEATFAVAAIESVTELLGSMIADPIRGVVYLGFLTVLARIAFPK